uniref:Uncharacterized protein n=1 Tax=Setaria digitata TaxID=48799 RepID=A0A915Q5T3_9BILA
MSLLPMRSLSDSLPVLFIEARLQGPPEIVFSQMGISFDTDKCNVALLVRTSGVLLVASVGSYMMYRVCTRLLGKNFIWTILEQARFDLLPRNEAYLLNPKMSYVTNNDYENNCCSEELANDKESDNLYARYDNQIISTVQSSHRLQGIKKFRKNSVGISKRPSEGTSDNTKHSVSIESQNFSDIGFTSSEKSASLHLLWDDPEWDEETDLCFYGAAAHLDHHSLSSNVSDMTEFRAARFLFEESDDLSKIDRDDQRNCENSRREERIIDLDTSDFIQKNCMTDSKHLYQITAGFTTRTNSMSVSSEHSSQSFLSLKQRLIANASSCGLLELVQSSTALPPISADHLITSMTDSGISRGTVSTSNLQLSIKSTDPKCFFGLGAEDEIVGLGMAVTMCKRNSVIGRANLNLISEDHCSTTGSTRSMEWFEDDYSSYANQDSIREPFQMEIDDPLSACFSHSSRNQLRSSSSEDRRKYLYSITRDLMAWAREQFAPKSPQLKALQALYMSQRWRRIGLKRSSNSSEQFLCSLLHVMLIHGIPFFSCSDALVIAKVSSSTV